MPPSGTTGVESENDSRSSETEPRDPAWHTPNDISTEFASLSNETDSETPDKSEAEAEEIDSDNEVEGDDVGKGKVVRIKHFFGKGDGTLSGVKNVNEFIETIEAAQGANGWDADVTAR